MKRTRCIVRSQEGLTLIELLMTFGLLGVVLTAVLMFFQQSRQAVRRVGERTALVQTLSVIEEDVMKDVPYIPAHRLAAGGTDADFDTAIAGSRCYDQFGGSLGNCNGFPNGGAQFQVSFYKHTNYDPSMPNAALQRMPVSLIRFRVRYLLNGQVQEPIYFTRIHTEIVRN